MFPMADVISMPKPRICRQGMVDSWLAQQLPAIASVVRPMLDRWASTASYNPSINQSINQSIDCAFPALWLGVSKEIMDL